MDKELDIGRGQTSKELAKKISLISIFVPFDHGLKFFQDLLMFTIPKRILQNVTYQVGKVFTDYHQTEITSDEKVELLQGEYSAVDVQYFLTDGGQTPLLEKTSSDNNCKPDSKSQKKAENQAKSAKQNEKQYRETKIGVFFSDKDLIKRISRSGKEKLEIVNKRFVVSLNHGLDHFKKAVQKASVLHKTFRAKVIVFISDGSEWCKTIQGAVFPGCVRILDYFHASEHLWQAAIKFFGDGKKADYTAWAKPLENLLWDGNISLLLKIIQETIADTSRDQTPLRNLYNYYKGNEDAMNYKEFRDKGYFIGSGSIESAVKYILTARLKQTGCHWRRDNAEALLWLRCKYFEDRWNEFWESMTYRDFLTGKNVFGLVA